MSDVVEGRERIASELAGELEKRDRGRESERERARNCAREACNATDSNNNSACTMYVCVYGFAEAWVMHTDTVDTHTKIYWHIARKPLQCVCHARRNTQSTGGRYVLFHSLSRIRAHYGCVRCQFSLVHMVRNRCFRHLKFGTCGTIRRYRCTENESERENLNSERENERQPIQTNSHFKRSITVVSLCVL